MGRRHHGHRSHRNGPPRAIDPSRRPIDAAAAGRSAVDPRPAREPETQPATPPVVPVDAQQPAATASAAPETFAPAPASPASAAPAAPIAPAAPAPGPRPEINGSHLNGSPPPAAYANGAPPAAPAGCTAPQLRRFIKSRPYVPMHELRRRFGINGPEDDVSAIDLGDRRVFVGLPAREGSLLGELLRGGDIGYELSLDPQVPVVVGLYPMRPVARG